MSKINSTSLIIAVSLFLSLSILIRGSMINFESMKVAGEEIVYSEEKLTSNPDSTAYKKMEEILADDLSYNIVAPLGSGKTFGVIKICTEKKLPFILIVPYRAVSDQLLQDCNGKEISLSSNRILFNESKIDEVAKNNYILTYEGFLKILDFQTEFKDHILIIDEFHNFCTQLNFRGHTLYRIIENIHIYKKILKISGTPEGIFLPDENNIIFQPLNNGTSAKIKLIESYNFTNDSIIDYISASIDTNKKAVLLVNNSKRATRIKDILFQKLKTKINKKNITLITKEKKGGIEYNNIITENEISANTKILITTILLADGVNILNDNIGCVITLNITNMLQLRQFSRRFRIFKGEIISIIEKTGQRTSIDVLARELAPITEIKDYYPHLNNNIQFTEQLKELITSNLGDTFYSDFYKKWMIFSGNSFDKPYIQKLNENVISVFKEAIIMQYLNAIDVVCYNNIDERQKYLEVIGGFSVTKEKVLPKEPPQNLTNSERIKRIENGIELLNIERMSTLSSNIPELNIELMNLSDEEEIPLTINRTDHRSIYLIHIINEFNSFFIYPHISIKLIKSNASKNFFWDHINIFMMRVFNMTLKAGYNKQKSIRFYKYSDKGLSSKELSVDALTSIKSAINGELINSCGEFKVNRETSINNSSASILGQLKDLSGNIIEDNWVNYIIEMVIDMEYYSKTSRSKRIYKIDKTNDLTKGLSLTVPGELENNLDAIFNPLHD